MKEKINTQIIGSKMRLCMYCGSEIPENAIICTLCGGRVESVSHQKEARPQIIISFMKVK